MRFSNFCRARNAQILNTQARNAPPRGLGTANAAQLHAREKIWHTTHTHTTGLLIIAHGARVIQSSARTARKKAKEKSKSFVFSLHAAPALAPCASSVVFFFVCVFCVLGVLVVLFVGFWLLLGVGVGGFGVGFGWLLLLLLWLVLGCGVLGGVVCGGCVGVVWLCCGVVLGCGWFCGVGLGVVVFWLWVLLFVWGGCFGGCGVWVFWWGGVWWCWLVCGWFVFVFGCVVGVLWCFLLGVVVCCLFLVGGLGVVVGVFVLLFLVCFWCCGGWWVGGGWGWWLEGDE